MITVNNIKAYVLELLKETGYAFNIVTDLGDYEEAKRTRNRVKQTINGLLRITQSELSQLSGGIMAVSYQAAIEFLLPLGDIAVQQEYPTVTQFRDKLSGVLSRSMKISISDDDNKVYEGGIVYSLPTVGQRNIRDSVGDSVNYTCVITVAFMENAINTSDLGLFIDGVKVAFADINITRQNALSSDLLSKNANEEASVYAESSSFKIDFTLPALKSVPYANGFLRYLLGTQKANKPMTVKLLLEEDVIMPEKQMIFGGGGMSGSGVSNLANTITLVPYTAPELIEG